MTKRKAKASPFSSIDRGVDNTKLSGAHITEPMFTTQAIKDLLLWARKERILLNHVKVGDVEVVVTTDYKLTAPAVAREIGEPAKEPTFREYMAGDLLNPPAATRDASDVNEPTIEDDDE